MAAWLVFLRITSMRKTSVDVVALLAMVMAARKITGQRVVPQIFIEKRYCNVL